MANQTFFNRNNAPRGNGSSIYLSERGTLQYTLPVPPGRWLFVPSGTTFQLTAGAVDGEFPFPCNAGLVGGTSVEDQSGPQCARPW